MDADPSDRVLSAEPGQPAKHTLCVGRQQRRLPVVTGEIEQEKLEVRAVHGVELGRDLPFCEGTVCLGGHLWWSRDGVLVAAAGKFSRLCAGESMH